MADEERQTNGDTATNGVGATEERLKDGDATTVNTDQNQQGMDESKSRTDTENNFTESTATEEKATDAATDATEEPPTEEATGATEGHDGVTTNGVTERIEETEEMSETEEKQKIVTSESGHLESTVESSAPVDFSTAEENEEAKEEDEAQQTSTSVASEEQKVSSPEFAPSDQVENASEPVSGEVSDHQEVQEVVPENEDTKIVDEVSESASLRTDGGVSSVEIGEPSIKAQLKEILQEIDADVKKAESLENEEESRERQHQQQQQQGGEEDGGDGQVYHTWQPRGKYELQHTVVEHEDVVPITVDDVKEPDPVVVPTKVADPGSQTSQQQQQQDNERQSQMEPIGQIIVPQLLPNGELGSPIQIPEGIPLLARVLPQEEDSHREKIPLERLFTPATDSGDITPRKKKAAFASSDFYAPNHPTIDDQLQLAQKISESLADQNNKMSRGQAMYEKRKQRSEKWIHQATGTNNMMPLELQQMDMAPQNKPTLKLVMNPKGTHDHTTVEQHYQQLMEQSNVSSSTSVGGTGQIPASPEIVKDIMNDMQSPTGKGAALFAKRKKRMDKFIVDETNVQKSSAYQQEQQNFVNSSVSQTSSNQFSSSKTSTSTSSSSFSSSSKVQQQQKSAGPAPAAPGSKKKWLQEKDQEQQLIMDDFMKNREAQFKMVKTPWESVLQTGNTSSAFQQTEQTKRSFSSTLSSSSETAAAGPNVPSWLEMPKPVPVTAPMPKAEAQGPFPTPPSPFARPAPPAGGATSNVAPAPAPAFAAAKPVAPTPAAPTPPPFVAPAAPVAPAPVAPNPVAHNAFAPNPVASGQNFTGQGFASQAELDERRKTMNFNLAANGWGNYNKYYRPISFAT